MSSNRHWLHPSYRRSLLQAWVLSDGLDHSTGLVIFTQSLLTETQVFWANVHCWDNQWRRELPKVDGHIIQCSDLLKRCHLTERLLATCRKLHTSYLRSTILKIARILRVSYIGESDLRPSRERHSPLFCHQHYSSAPGHFCTMHSACPQQLVKSLQLVKVWPHSEARQKWPGLNQK